MQDSSTETIYYMARHNNTNLRPGTGQDSWGGGGEEGALDAHPPDLSKHSQSPKTGADMDVKLTVPYSALN